MMLIRRPGWGTVPKMSDVPLPRLWCCASAQAPIVAVFARCHASVRATREYRDSAKESGSRWSCILRWNWKTGEVVEGTWTTMELRPLRAVVSASGEFLLFHAKTNDDGPFSAKAGPRYAVARLPWLVPLTHPQSFGPGGAGLSQHALSKPQQERLWAMFPGFFWRQTDDEWPRHLTAGAPGQDPERTWQSVTFDHSSFEGAGFVDMVRGAPLDDGSPRPLAPHLIAMHPILTTPSGAALTLVAAVPRRPENVQEPGIGWNVWEGQLRFYVHTESSAGRRIELLDGVRWAKPTSDGRLLTAGADCKLRVLRATTSGTSVSWSTIQEHDLSGLAPNPVTAPREAMAGLR
jgi:hypothetical protein